METGRRPHLATAARFRCPAGSVLPTRRVIDARIVGDPGEPASVPPHHVDLKVSGPVRREDDPVAVSRPIRRHDQGGRRCAERARILAGSALTTRLAAAAVSVGASSRHASGGPKPVETRLLRPCACRRLRPGSIEPLASTGMLADRSSEPPAEETKPDSTSSMFSEGSAVPRGVFWATEEAGLAPIGGDRAAAPVDHVGEARPRVIGLTGVVIGDVDGASVLVDNVAFGRGRAPAGGDRAYQEIERPQLEETGPSTAGACPSGRTPMSWGRSAVRRTKGPTSRSESASPSATEACHGRS